MNRRLINILVALLLLSACGTRTGGPDTWDMEYVGVTTGGTSTMISRAIDREAGVVCWVYSNGYQGGISCLPLSETDLTADSFPQK